MATPEITLSSREDALLHVLLKTTKRLSTRDLVEEFCAFQIWPLAREWKLEPKTSESGLLSLAVEGRTGEVCGGVVFEFGFSLFILTATFCNSCTNHRSRACCEGSVGPLHGR